MHGVNRTPIVGLKKFRFDDRRCGSFVCVRIEGDVTTMGSGARRWNPSRPEPARTRSSDGARYDSRDTPLEEFRSMSLVV